ncbi:MAG: methyltransferase domain-containing protein [Aggregatilineales bacterium]
MMTDNFLQSTEKSYDNIVETYQQRISDELAKKPFDRKMLQLLIEQSPADSALCDMGCGPGHIGAYLQQQGIIVTGIDLSPGMIATAEKSL